MSEWFFTQDGKSLGPVSAAELQDLATSGQLRPSDLVWKQGMADWMPARQADVLFPAAPRKRPRVDDEPDEPRSRRRAYADDDDRPRRARRTVDDDEVDDVRPRRRRAAQGSSNTLMLVLAIGGGVLVVGIVIIAIILLTGSSSPLAPKIFQLDNGKMVFWHVTFREKNKVEIRVTSNGDSDVDLFVYDANNRLVVKDEDDSQHCYVTFVPDVTQKYKVEVQNRMRLDAMWRNKPNSGTVTFTETPLDKVPNQPKQPIKMNDPPKKETDKKFPPPIDNQPPVIGIIPLNAGQGSWTGNLDKTDPVIDNNPNKRCKEFIYPMQAGKTYTIDMKSTMVDSYLLLVDPNGIQVAVDDDSGGFPNARIVHTATKTGAYRIKATTFLGGMGNFQLTVVP